jgi:hypothetical protein
MRRRPNRPNDPSITSTCGDIRIRGNVQQVIEKYMVLAQEAADHEREMLLQHAEHYRRVRNERQQHVQ